MAWWGGVTQEDPRPRRGDGSWLRAQGGLSSSPRALHLPPPQDSLPLGNLAPSQPPTALATLQALLRELRTPNSSPGPLWSELPLSCRKLRWALGKFPNPLPLLVQFSSI